MPDEIPDAEAFMKALEVHRSDEEREKYGRYFRTGKGEYGEGDVFMGVRMGQVFELAKRARGMPVEELETLLESPIHEARAGAVSIMDKETRSKSTSDRRREELYRLYLGRTDRINNWDLVDLGAPFVVGRYLFHRPRDVLYQLARSDILWERRIAMVSTLYFVRQGEVEDTFRIAELLLGDDHDLIHKAVGTLLRAAGGKDPEGLRGFLDRHAATMPRVALRTAMEHFDREERRTYMDRKAPPG